jgi:subtilisin family serine protease
LSILRKAGVFSAAGAVAFGTVTGAQQPAQAAQATGTKAGGALPAGTSWTVTLVTGDVVGVRRVAGGPPLVTIKPGAGRTGVIFSDYVDTAGHIRVLPQDVAPLIGKVLDPTLFDVTTLIKDGDDDARRSGLPLIVRGTAGASGHTAAQNLAVPLQHRSTLSSIGAESVVEPKGSAVRLGAKLAAIATASRRTGRLTPSVSGDLGYIWLDRTVTTGTIDAKAGASGPLDHNLAQIGAPAAWSRGDTGTGVTVAVLDTGIDDTFPDLAGRIAAEQNFSSSADTVDHFGHGTFVAAQIAGSGAASGGQRRGVAFGSRLVIGKVLGDDGFGQESDIIAGMQWAATRAQVISMSLGSFEPSDGTDAMSAAVNQLTDADGVLFVIAAGNTGPAQQTVGTPGAATDALTVGAVDATDKLAPFSSRGPRPGDYAIKPEIVAPGVNIAGARAAGTAMSTIVDAHYVIASGTSMATPQVAGAAAILYQLHPGWSPEQVKATLVGTAHAATGGDEYELGGGRLDVAAAIGATATTNQAVADLGSIPDDAAAPVTDTLTLADITTHPETLHISASLTDRAGVPAPAGAIDVSADTVHVAAAGKASVTVSLDPARVTDHPGLYEGRVTIRDGARTLHIPISLDVNAPMHNLTLTATALPGTASGDFSAHANVMNAEDPTLLSTFVDLSSGSATIQVPDGDYWVSGEVDDFVSPTQMRSAIVGQPDVLVGGDTAVTLDAATAVPISASVTGRATEYDGADLFTERGIGGQIFSTGVYSFNPTTQVTLFAQPTDAVRTGTFKVSSGFRLIDPSAPSAYVYDLFHNLGDRIPDSLAYTVTPAVQAHLSEIDERFYGIDGDTTPYGENRYGLTDSGFLALQFLSTVPGESTRTDYVSTEPGIGWNQEAAPPITLDGQKNVYAWVTEIPGFTHYAPGSKTTADWAKQVFRPGPYSATALSTSFCAPQPSTRAAGNIHVELVDLQDLPDGYDCLQGIGATTQTMRLYHGADLLGTVNSSIGDFAVPAGSGTYRLVYDESTSAIPVSTRTSTAWTFHSTAPVGPSLRRLPLLTINYDLPLGLDNHPDGDTAILTASRVAGSESAAVKELRLWTSTDGGATWATAPVHALGDGRYAATLPHAASGQAVSLRVQASDAGGSAIDQTVITAYRG